MMTSIEGGKQEALRALVRRILEGDGRASPAQRRAAFDNVVTGQPLRTLLEGVALEPTRVTDDDFAAVEAAGISQDEVFELVICAAAGQATRQYETALNALAEASRGDAGD